MTNQEKLKLVERFAVYGVPASSIPNLMKELNLNESKFYEFMSNQTVVGVGGEAIYYIEDIMRFINDLPVID